MIFDPDTGKLLDRDALKSVGFGNVYHGGYSTATGTYVAGPKDLVEQNKVNAAAMTERMGYEVTYGLADPTDKKHLGVTEDG